MTEFYPGMVYIHLGNALTGEVSAAGPFHAVQVTYNYRIRVDDDRTIATFAGGLWRLYDGTDWTDITVSTVLGGEA